MPELLNEKGPRRTFALALGVLVALAGGFALAAGVMHFRSEPALAAPADLSVDKADGVEVNGMVEWYITLSNNGSSSEVVQLVDTYQPHNTGTMLTGSFTYDGGGPIVCSDEFGLDCDVTLFAGETATLTFFSTIVAQCEPGIVVFNHVAVRLGGQHITGSPDDDNFFTQPSSPAACGVVFELCKDWDTFGSISPMRDFVFDVSDSSESEEVTVPDVVEGGDTECVLISAAPGLVIVAEHVPASFNTPSWEIDGGAVQEGDQAGFVLSANGCEPAISFLTRAVEALVFVVPNGSPVCTVTFVNTDFLPPPTTPTPYVPGCTNCRTPFVPTNTPVPPTPVPSNTAVPPTPTISTGTQSPGLTDEQRTQTAVAGAKTAAALITPKPPATGSATLGGTGQGVNLLLVLVGLTMAAGGLGLVANRRR